MFCCNYVTIFKISNKKCESPEEDHVLGLKHVLNLVVDIFATFLP